MKRNAHEGFTNHGAGADVTAPPQASGPSDVRYAHGMERLVQVVQELSLSRSLEAITTIVRHAARDLTGADGATFVLRDGDLCYYVDEDAISPLWKGHRFPMNTCISGWSMLHRQPVVIEDIYADDRIPHDAYRPTFVKSLLLVPIRTLDPLGAIGTYWAHKRKALEYETKLLCALADTVAVAMENVRVYGELEERVRQRTAQLEAANKELETFNYTVSHDLRAPLRAIRMFAKAFADEFGDPTGAAGVPYLERIQTAAERMDRLIDDMLKFSRHTRAPVRRQRVDLSRIAREIAEHLQHTTPGRKVNFVIGQGHTGLGDAGLLRVALENLLMNAWKFSGEQEEARIEFGAETGADGERVFFVRDNGVGFDEAYADQLFQPFQRLHPSSTFPGTGVGLATVHRILQHHGERIWAVSAPGQGATFYFTLANEENA